jgi:uncharacterized membrane protein YoaK (UPF0700 family)
MTSGILKMGPLHGLASETATGGLAMTATHSGDETAFWASFLRDPVHGPLPALLLVLTMMSGLIDAASILGLGRVFVANMTGNVVFIGFALAHAPGFSLMASVAALLGFLVGAFLAGIMVAKFAGHRGLLLRNACAVQFLLLAVALAVVLPSRNLSGSGIGVVVAALCAIAMGIQNTAARRLAVPDLTTTVLTMTLTGIAADTLRSSGLTTARRALAVLTMLLGAVLGALLVLHTGLASALGAALFLLGLVVAATASSSRRPAPWHTYRVTS